MTEYLEEPWFKHIFTIWNSVITASLFGLKIYSSKMQVRLERLLPISLWIGLMAVLLTTAELPINIKFWSSVVGHRDGNGFGT